MRKFVIFVLTAALFSGVQASWYWPFGSDEIDEKPKRVSTLIEQASLLIEEASDLAAEDKTNEAVEKYRLALAELNRVELENPERAKTAEFATLRNKRAYVNAAIDALLLGQVQSNAKAVAVSDTTELEKRLDRERWGKRMDKAREALDRCNPSSALGEFEKAQRGTTNAFLIAITHIAIAGAHCQQGAFKESCRSLVRAQQGLLRIGTLSHEEKHLVSEFLKTLRTGAIEGYAKTLVEGRRTCKNLAELAEANDLTTENAVLQASNTVVSVTALRENVKIFAFPAAQNLNRASSNLLACVSLLLERMESRKNPKWNVDATSFQSAVEAFGRVMPEIKDVNTVISSVFLVVRGDEKKKEKKKGAEKEKALTPAPLPKISKSSKHNKPAKTLTKREKVLIATAKGDWTTAERLIGEMLVEKPNGAMALNLKAALETQQKKFKEAEDTLDQAIQSNPRSHFAYYNMANLMLQVRPDDKSAAKRYYETGRMLGGPVDASLEEALK